jgi:hypothetical protein
LNPSGFSLGLRSVVDGNINRSQIKSGHFTWKEQDDFVEGTAVLSAGGANAIQCFANYNSINYGSTWLIDKSISINTRHIAFLTFDRDLNKLKKELFPDEGIKERAREFEMAVCWLFWILGFNPVQLDGQFGLPESPDFILFDELGQAITVECTTGRTSVNDKLEKLAERHLRMKSSFRANRADFVKSYAIVVSRGQSDVSHAELTRAKQNEVTIVGSSQLRQLFESVQSPKRPSEIIQNLTSAIPP